MKRIVESFTDFVNKINKHNTKEQKFIVYHSTDFDISDFDINKASDYLGYSSRNSSVLDGIFLVILNSFHMVIFVMK